MEKEIVKENEKKLEEYVVKEMQLDEIIRHKEKMLRKKYLLKTEKTELAKTKDAHRKIQEFCGQIQEKFAKVLIQRETILVQVR